MFSAYCCLFHFSAKERVFQEKGAGQRQNCLGPCLESAVQAENCSDQCSLSTRQAEVWTSLKSDRRFWMILFLNQRKQINFFWKSLKLYLTLKGRGGTIRYSAWEKRYIEFISPPQAVLRTAVPFATYCRMLPLESNKYQKSEASLCKVASV